MRKLLRFFYIQGLPSPCSLLIDLAIRRLRHEEERRWREEQAYACIRELMEA
jgi:hypothetical protein